MSPHIRISILALLTALAAQGTTAQTAPASPDLFSADQAQQGEILFNNNCAQCHRPDLTGALGPALKGPAFMARWGNKPLSDLYQFEHTQMPENSPGSLSDAEMLPITAFILSKNGIAPGQTPLSSAGMSQTIPATASANAPQAPGKAPATPAPVAN